MVMTSLGKRLGFGILFKKLYGLGLECSMRMLICRDGFTRLIGSIELWKALYFPRLLTACQNYGYRGRHFHPGGNVSVYTIHVDSRLAHRLPGYRSVYSLEMKLQFPS